MPDFRLPEPESARDTGWETGDVSCCLSSVSSSYFLMREGTSLVGPSLPVALGSGVVGGASGGVG